MRAGPSSESKGNLELDIQAHWKSKTSSQALIMTVIRPLPGSYRCEIVSLPLPIMSIY